jgi:hypothetical protein
LTADERGNDRQAAAQSAIEGHATLIMFQYALEQLGGEPVDLLEIPNIDQMLEIAMEAMRTQYPALASAPTIIREGLLFPYLKGYSFVSAFWATREDRPAPFGAFLPQSTEQILQPSRAFGSDTDHPTDLDIDPVPGFETLWGNTLGQWELEVLLEEHLGEDAKVLASGWDGDRWALLKGSDGAEGLVWVSVWDSEAERDRFVNGFQPALPKLGAPATLEAMGVVERPGAILRVGIPGDVQVHVEGRETG